MSNKVKKEKAEFVKFLIHKTSGELIAYFPRIVGDNSGNKTCYAHIGQHSACSPLYAKECRYAKKPEYEALYNELVNSVGYVLKVAKGNL